MATNHTCNDILSLGIYISSVVNWCNWIYCGMLCEADFSSVSVHRSLQIWMTKWLKVLWTWGRNMEKWVTFFLACSLTQLYLPPERPHISWEIPTLKASISDPKVTTLEFGGDCAAGLCRCSRPATVACVLEIQVGLHFKGMSKY